MNDIPRRRGENTRRDFTKTATIHTRLHNDLALRLKLRAQKDRLSPGEVNRRALEAYLLADA